MTKKYEIGGGLLERLPKGNCTRDGEIDCYKVSVPRNLLGTTSKIDTEFIYFPPSWPAFSKVQTTLVTSMNY